MFCRFLCLLISTYLLSENYWKCFLKFLMHFCNFCAPQAYTNLCKQLVSFLKKEIFHDNLIISSLYRMWKKVKILVTA